MPSFKIVILLAWLVVDVSQVAGTGCEGNYSCLLETNLVDQFSRTETLADCHLRCLETEECQVFSLNTALSVCTLLSSCHTPDFSCSHCVTAPRYCQGDCQPLGSDYGGTWHCFPPVTHMELPVSDQTVCVLECYQEDLAGLTCHTGDWRPGQPGDQVCHYCPPLPQVEEADLTCSSEYIQPGTSCQYQCGSDQLTFTGEWSRTCQEDGTWSGGETQFSCHQREQEQSLLVVGGLYPPIWPDFVSVVDQLTGSQTLNTTVPPLPAGRAYLTAAGLGPLVAVCDGAQHCEDCSEDLAQCLLWEQGSQAWFDPREDADYSPPAVLYREAADTVVVNNTIWIIGGKHYNQSVITTNTVEIFSPTCLTDTSGDCRYWRPGPDLPAPVFDSCSVQLSGSVFLSGGHGPGYPGQYVYDSLSQYVVETNTWVSLTTMPVDRYGHGCAEYEGEIFISGGYSWTQDRLGRVDVFSPQTATWRQLADLNMARNNHRMVLLNNILTVVGGYGAPASEYWAPQDLDNVEEYHPDIDQWILSKTRLSTPRRSFGGAVISNQAQILK